MKYIRTKDGIYKYADYLGVHNGKRYALMDNAQGDRITMCQEPEELYKVADTIEELCDEFVMIDEENEHYIKQDNDIHHIRRKWAIGNYTVYGAIWTDKGLIYVAKMNDEGELELL